MKNNHSMDPNPALQDLDVLVGHWTMELSNASFLPQTSDVVTGQVTFEWLMAGAFFVMYMGERPPGTPDATWLISRDESVPHYHTFYYDTRKVSRVYEMSFSDGIWKMWRNSSDFSQRFEGQVSKDGKTITAHWEKSSDGLTWEHDFDVKYIKGR